MKNRLLNQTKSYCIRNTDGSIRWIWPAHLSRPLFLKFYQVSSFKQRCYAFCIQLIFQFKLQRFFFEEKMYPSNFDEQIDWAEFTGTPGPNRKTIIYFEDQQGTGHFIKSSNHKSGKKLLKQEAWNCMKMQAYKDCNSFEVPELEQYENGFLQLSDLNFREHTSAVYSADHNAALLELSEMNQSYFRLGQWDGLNKMRDLLHDLNLRADERIPRGLIRKMEFQLNQLNMDQWFKFNFAHGDFTPWNAKHLKDGKLGIIDWELAEEQLPMGYDFFHFQMQNGILCQGQNWAQILQEIKKHAFSFDSEDQMKDYLTLFLLQHICKYLHIYQNQKDWHVQVEWQLKVWSEALTYLVADKKEDRKIFILDLFDQLRNKQYATLKLNCKKPEYIPFYSDLDILIQKKDKKQIGFFIQKHPLVDKVQVMQQSFMSTYKVVFKDGTMLPIDLLWTFKRKSLRFLEPKPIIKTAVQEFQVKKASLYHTARFVGMFYALNKTWVPAKYQLLSTHLNNSAHTVDKLLLKFYKKEEKASKLIEDYQKHQIHNKGLACFKNRMLYGFDLLRRIFQNRGMMITFSGVDGAGKSTIIETLKKELERVSRSPVIVLRHRPSILPILSAWKYGKKNAEQRSISKLPRTGNNKNVFSSAIRFAYYYIDYLIGQLYVHCKYVRRGYTVIYDRYYFDFINDSRRSNIHLPKKLIRSAYQWLMAPDFNFFLHAKPELILARKQELDKNTIIALTESYKTLFEELESQDSNARYINIENTDMDLTLERVCAYVCKKAS